MVSHRTKSGHKHQELINNRNCLVKMSCHFSSMHWKRELLLSYSRYIRAISIGNNERLHLVSISNWNTFSNSVRTCPIKRYYDRTYWEGRLNPLYLSLGLKQSTDFRHMVIPTYLCACVKNSCFSFT